MNPKLSNFFKCKLEDLLHEADKLALLVIILLLADVLPTYTSGLPQGNVFSPRITCNLLITRNNEQYDVQRQKTQN